MFKGQRKASAAGNIKRIVNSVRGKKAFLKKNHPPNW